MTRPEVLKIIFEVTDALDDGMEAVAVYAEKQTTENGARVRAAAERITRMRTEAGLPAMRERVGPGDLSQR